MSKRIRYVLYKTDDWNRPLYYQWYRVSLKYGAGWAGKSFFSYLLSRLEDWEPLFDQDPTETVLENMRFVAGFETKEAAISHGKQKGWMSRTKI